jgi:hypothetical protein
MNLHDKHNVTMNLHYKHNDSNEFIW